MGLAFPLPPPSTLITPPHLNPTTPNPPGPSGGGKTCLLDILAGRKNVGHTSGTRLVDGVPVPVAAPTAADRCVRRSSFGVVWMGWVLDGRPRRGRFLLRGKARPTFPPTHPDPPPTTQPT